MVVTTKSLPVSCLVYLCTTLACFLAAGCVSPPIDNACCALPQETRIVHKQRRTADGNGLITEDSVAVLPGGREVEDGISKTYYLHNGQVLCLGNYCMGEKDGVWRRWGIDGKLRLLETYRHGSYDGAVVTFDHDSGDVLVLELYVQGIDHALSVHFHQNYRPARIQHRSSGGISGAVLEFHEHGMPSRFAEYSDDKLNGMSVGWDKDGNRTKVEKYNDDVKDK